jgi:hypothetical protein
MISHIIIQKLCNLIDWWNLLHRSCWVALEMATLRTSPRMEIPLGKRYPKSYLLLLRNTHNTKPCTIEYKNLFKTEKLVPILRLELFLWKLMISEAASFINWNLPRKIRQLVHVQKCTLVQAGANHLFSKLPRLITSK